MSYFHSCEKAVESRSIGIFLQVRDSCPCRNALVCPCRSARGPSGIGGPRTAAMSQRGIVSDWSVGGKRKIGEGLHRRSHPMHSFSTSTNLVQCGRSMRILAAFVNIFSRHARTVHRTRAGWPEENLAYFRFFLSGRSNSKMPSGSLPMIKRSLSTSMVLASSRAPCGV